MTSEGPNNPSTAVNDASVGTINWQSPTYVYSSNNFKSFIDENNSGTSKFLKITNFGFSIPSNATIDGIVVEFEKAKNASSTASDNAIRIIKNDIIGTTDKSVIGEWPTTDTYVSYGGISDLWGETWSYSDINSSNFGVAISVNTTTSSGEYTTIDHCRITVYYTLTEISSRKGIKQGLINRW